MGSCLRAGNPESLSDAQKIIIREQKSAHFKETNFFSKENILIIEKYLNRNDNG